ncbi:hypothetical protein HDU98_006751 [Podochytrium sp. JEL0797]|nr:hypothetical protein HDU98_006751 [Podochytrium sp. JEL0797]
MKLNEISSSRWKVLVVLSVFTILVTYHLTLHTAQPTPHRYINTTNFTSPTTHSPSSTTSQAYPPLRQCDDASLNFKSTRFGCVCLEGQAGCALNTERLQLRGNLTVVHVGEMNRLSVQFLGEREWPILLDEEAQGVPGLVVTIEALDMSERIFLAPSFQSQGLYEFDFKLLTANEFQVTIWIEGSEKRWKHTVEWMSSEEPRNYVYANRVFANKMNSIAKSAKDHLLAQFRTNPKCNAANVHDLKGRWISSGLVPVELMEGHVPTPSTPGRGSTMVFLPDACTIRYFSPQEAMQCLDNKRVLLAGDSTLNEVAMDFGMHLFMGEDDHWPRYITKESDDWSGENVIHPGGDTALEGGCDPEMIQRQFWWPIEVEGRHVEVNKFWAAGVDPCLNGGGSRSVANPVYLERFQRALYFKFPNDPNAGEKSPMPPLNQTIATDSLTDLVVFNTLLHDLVSGNGMRENGGYRIDMDEIMKGIKPGAKKHVYMLSNAKVGQGDVVVRYWNDVMRKVAKENGFFVYDAHSIQTGRLTGVEGFPNPVVGDNHHGRDGWQRSPFTHVPVQVLLNMFCAL